MAMARTPAIAFKALMVLTIVRSQTFGQSTPPEILTDGAGLTLKSGKDVNNNEGDIVLSTSDGRESISFARLTSVISQLNQALNDVDDLKSTVSTLRNSLENCSAKTDDLFQITSDHDSQILDLGGLKSSLSTVGSQITNTNSRLDTAIETQSVSEQGFDYAIQSLTNRVDALTNNSAVKCDAIGSIDPNLVVHDSVLKVKHVVGFHVHFQCKPGYGLFGAHEITCFPSGLYCDSDDFPSKPCLQQVVLPTCKPCPKGCTDCTSEGCTACDTENKPPLYLLGSKCVATSNCAGYHKGGALKQGVNKGFAISLSNSKISNNGACLVDDTDRVYEAFPCSDLLESGERCVATSTATEENTCDKHGYMLLSFRNKKHFSLMYSAFPSLMQSHVRTTGVHMLEKDANYRPDRPYTKCAMNSASNSLCSKDWGVVDGGDWWLMDAPYSEPNGDAKRYWYLVVNQIGLPNPRIVAINDHRGPWSTGNYYFCIPRGV